MFQDIGVVSTPKQIESMLDWLNIFRSRNGRKLIAAAGLSTVLPVSFLVLKYHQFSANAKLSYVITSVVISYH